MNRHHLLDAWRKLSGRARQSGWREALRVSAMHALQTQADTVPLARCNTSRFFASSVQDQRASQKEARRTREAEAFSLHSASNIDKIYPLVFHHGERLMRYARIPALRESRGLVVFFHGFNSWFHTGPLRPFDHFDLLAPWDTFGWKRQGSWFWGERGRDFVAEMVQALIRQEHADPGQPLFCMGSSMGGFGALYHGIELGCRAIYVMAPQVDLKAKIADYAAQPRNPYSFLQGEDPEALPDLFRLAEAQGSLPPLFLIQNLYDPVNEFSGHAYRLLDVYHRKRAWYGLRIHPGVHHEGDGSQAEAELFFALVLDQLHEVQGCGTD